MLPDCKIYWKHHSSLITCFADLRPFIQDLDDADQREFYEFAQTQAKEMGVNLGSDQVCIKLSFYGLALLLQQKPVKYSSRVHRGIGGFIYSHPPGFAC
jgi:hypothetical protein